MHRKKMKLAIIVLSILFSHQVLAKQCTTINWTKGKVIQINSSIGMGTRIQLPSPLLKGADIANSNNDLWDINGASTYIVVKPNSDVEQGKKAMMFAFLSDGSAIDFELTRTNASNNIPCVVINQSSAFLNEKTANSLNNNYQTQINRNDAVLAQNLMLQRQLTETKQQNKDAIAKAVSDALTRYRYHIYTRYDWTDGKGNFIGTNLISDVYDDGRFTYIRLANNNKGLLSIEAEVGGKNAIIPFKYDDSYAIYQIAGIYPNFKMKLDKEEIDISRTDNKTKGAF